MAGIKHTDLTKGARLLKQLVPKADLNGDEAIRDGDIRRLHAHAQENDAFEPVAAAMSGLRRSANKLGGPSIENIQQTIDDAVDKLKARDRDGNRKLDTAEEKRMTVAESMVLTFAKAAKNKKVRDFKFPEKREWKPGRFDYRGSAAEVCTSLLNAFSHPKNDNMWPEWARAPDGSRAARFVVDRDEAKTMVDALKKLYPNRQKAVLTELAARTERSVQGCVSPTDGGKTVFERYAAELGLDLEFGQPAAPHLHVS
ncbi:hypothetical protein L6R52_41245 [Myxococcota bacterium]|nr:hypothetical protein [Myxococcota bacterium]